MACSDWDRCGDNSDEDVSNYAVCGMYINYCLKGCALFRSFLPHATVNVTAVILYQYCFHCSVVIISLTGSKLYSLPSADFVFQVSNRYVLKNIHFTKLFLKRSNGIK